MNPDDLAARVLAKEVRAVARALRMVDDAAPGAEPLLRALWPHTGNAWVLGITGNPGSGKSTLGDALIAAYRARGQTVGVVAVDPTSPFTGGAVLGDRVRMSRHTLDPGVFIRSLATRGALGGLSRSATDAVRVLDASGYDVVMVETVGVGQGEIEIARTAQTTLVVMTPGLGDEIQASKAGLLECADVFAVNKADRDGADGVVRDLELMISLGNESILALSGQRGHLAHGASDGFVARPAPASPAASGWTPAIVKCVAIRGDGIADLVAALDRHRDWMRQSDVGKAHRKRRLESELWAVLRETLLAEAQGLRPEVEAAAQAIEQGQTDPYAAVAAITARFRGRTP